MIKYLVPNTLNRIECYKLSWGYDKIDGRFNNFEYFSTIENAKKREATKGKGTETDIQKVGMYIDECDNIYKIINLEKIEVDLPTKEEVLSKLTEKEKFVLGIMG